MRDEVYIPPDKPILQDDVVLLPPPKDIFAANALPYSGIVLDSTDGNPVAGATVYILSNGVKVGGGMTGNDGAFYFEVQPSDRIEISHASYLPTAVKASIYQNENFYIAELKRNEKDLPPVLLPPGTPSKKSDLWFFLALGTAYAVEQSKKKTVGKIDVGTVTAVGLAAVMFIGLDTLKKFLLELGIGQTPEGNQYDENVSNPNSFWSPLFYQKAPAGSLLLTSASCQWLWDEINDSFGTFGDDEARIFAAFKGLKTQSQLSFFSWWVQQNKGVDLLKWLKGTDYGPFGDHLSVKEIAVITDYVKKLPKYKL